MTKTLARIAAGIVRWPILRLAGAPRPARLVVLPTLVVLSGVCMGRVLAQAAGQPPDDVTAWPLIAAMLSLLAIGSVASFVTAVLRKAGDAGLKPQSIVYGVCFVMVAIGFIVSGGQLPLVDLANPATTAAAWLVLTSSLGRWAEVLYDIVLKLVLPTPAVEETPTPTR